jgi:hypothetical protein
MQLTEWKRFSIMAILLVGMLTLAACGSEVDTATVTGTEAGVVATETAVEETAVEGEAEGFTADESAVMTEVEVVTDTNVFTETVVTEIVTETQVMTDTNVIVNTEVMTDTEGMTDGEVETANVDNAGVAGRTIMGISGAEGALIRGSTLLDQDFTNRDGDVSGDLENLLIDMTTGDVLFTSIEYGGFLDLGDKDIVVPLSAFAWGTDNNLVLNFDEQTLENFPDVGNDWPNLTDPTWDDGVTAFWRDNQFDPSFDFTETNSNNVMWLSDMVGYQIFGLGDTPGSVTDVLVDMGKSRVKYIIVEYGGIGTAEGARLIPFTALNTSTAADGQLMFVEGFDMDMYNASPLYDPSMYDNNGLLSPEYGTEVDTYWNEVGFGEMD